MTFSEILIQALKNRGKVMKFTDGYWMTKKGFTLLKPQEVYTNEISKDKVVVFAPYQKIRMRGDILNIGLTTAELTSPGEDMIRVRLYHHEQVKNGPEFDITETDTSVDIKQTDKIISFQSGKLKALISTKGAYGIQFFGDNQLLTASKPNAQAYITSEDGTNYMREQLSLDIDEKVYGLGERFTPFVKNGQTVDIWNEDGGTGSEQAYKNIPFYLTSNGYGVFVNSTGKVSYEIASENVSRAQFSVPGEELEYIVIYGPTPKDILEKYTTLTGKPALPPAWSFGLWLSTSFTTDYSEATVMSFIEGMHERDIPLEVFHFDCYWMKGFEWCNFIWDEKLFPDPKGMIERIHQKGIKVCVWINPYIAQKSPLFKEGAEKGYFIKTADQKQVWQWDMWQAGQGIVDFTNPSAVKWYQNHLAALLDMGVDAFKTDFGERIPVENVSYFDHSDPELMHNYYTQLYNQAVFSVLEEKRGKNDAVLFARSATVGGQKFPVHWGGDNLSEYVSMAETLRGGLSFLLSGFGFWSHDIGGFEENASADIYKRWTQFGLMSTHSRYHGNIQYRVPWVYDDEAVAVTRKFTQLKVSLMPYLYQQAVLTAKTGIPMMRPMFLEYAQDLNTYYLDKQYFLGDNLLVAPIFTATGDVTYYLPKGKWTQLLTGQVKVIESNGEWQKEQHDYLSMPIWVKENAILVMSNDTHQSVSYDYTQNITIRAYQLSPGLHQQVLVNHQGETVGEVQIIIDEQDIDVKVTGVQGESYLEVYQGNTVFRQTI